MSTKRHGNRIVSDLSKAILFIVKKGASNLNEVVELLGGSFQDSEIRKRVYSLRDNKFLIKDLNQELRLTSKGLEALENLKLKTLNSKKPWDHKWRLVIYDIPESKRDARNKIRELLKTLGFSQLQMSVWTHPLPCLEQFKAIRQAYGIQHHLYLFEVDDSIEFNELRASFAKRYPQIKVH